MTIKTQNGEKIIANILITFSGLLLPSIAVLYLPHPLAWATLFWGLLSALRAAAWRLLRSRRLEPFCAPWELGALAAIVCATFLTLSGWFWPLLTSIAILHVILTFSAAWQRQCGLFVATPAKPTPELQMAYNALTTPTVRPLPLREEDIRILIQRERLAGQAYDFECLLPENRVINWSGSPVRFSPDGRYGIASRYRVGLYICDRQQNIQCEFASLLLPLAQEIILRPGDAGRLTLQQLFERLITASPAPRTIVRQLAPYQRRNYIVARDEDLMEVARQADRFSGRSISALLDRLGKSTDYGDFDRGLYVYEWRTATKKLSAWVSSDKINHLAIADVPPRRADDARNRA